ncbi:hypothetical protein QBC43DRAFT_63966 [Cladorrhinum sp. PSN259]|nr:hypothetical protein QBC43DRAFT_63966 [Cladorrhinum sp. PSN259]
MDPVSITGLVGSCFSLLASTAKAIKGLHDLKGKYDDAVADAGHLLSQISTIQASVQILQKWLDSGPVTLQSNEQLMVTMEQSLDSCLLVVSSIEKHISKINYVDGMLTVRGKLRHVWDEEEVSRHKQNLSYQSQTLTLLLTAIQIRRPAGFDREAREPANSQAGSR